MFYAARLSRRVKVLSDLIRLTEAVLGKLSFSAEPVAAMWRRLGEEGERSLLLRRSLGYMERMPVRESWQKAVEDTAGEGLILPEDEPLIKELGETMGTVGLAEQCAYLETYRMRLEQAEQRARRLADEKAPVFRMAGLAGGVCLALLFW